MGDLVPRTAAGTLIHEPRDESYTDDYEAVHAVRVDADEGERIAVVIGNTYTTIETRLTFAQARAFAQEILRITPERLDRVVLESATGWLEVTIDEDAGLVVKETEAPPSAFVSAYPDPKEFSINGLRVHLDVLGRWSTEQLLLTVSGEWYDFQTKTFVSGDGLSKDQCALKSIQSAIVEGQVVAGPVNFLADLDIGAPPAKPQPVRADPATVSPSDFTINGSAPQLNGEAEWQIPGGVRLTRSDCYWDFHNKCWVAAPHLRTRHLALSSIVTVDRDHNYVVVGPIEAAAQAMIDAGE